jgi:D-serine deaminase-like pyridoxal phosphate-dependent protein
MSNLPAIPKDLDTPALLLDIKVLRSNLKKMQDLCDANGVSIRPHAKTHRIPEIGLLQIESGAEGLCVAKLGEAEGFADAGIKKITVAYPIIGELKAKRALALSERVDLVLATDSFEGASSVCEVFDKAGKEISLLLIINTGLNRDGVLPEEAGLIAQKISKIPGSNLLGILTHEGSVYQSHNQKDLQEKSISVAEKMLNAASEMQKYGVNPTLISMGASASAKFVAAVPGINQVRPGIYAFNDLGQVALGNAEFSDCAATVISTVVSTPSPERAIIDAGSKTLSKDLIPSNIFAQQYAGHGLILDAPGWVITKLSEEHGFLEWQGEGTPTELKIGDRLQIIPNHICTVFSSLNECFVIEDEKITANWKTLKPGASR